MMGSRDGSDDDTTAETMTTVDIMEDGGSPAGARGGETNRSDEMNVMNPVKLFLRTCKLPTLPSRDKSFKWSVALLYHAYLAYAIYYHETRRSPRPDWEFCSGIGFVVIVTTILYVLVILRVMFAFTSRTKLAKGAKNRWNWFFSFKLARVLTKVAVAVAIVAFLILDTAEDRRRLVSGVGLLVLILISFALSSNWKAVNWSLVMNGMVLQFLFGLLILRWTPGKDFFDCIGQKVDAFLEFNDAGSTLAYGHLVNRKPFLPHRLPNDSLAYNVTKMVNDHEAAPSVVAFKSLTIIFFFSFVVNMFFYLGWLQTVIVRLGYLLKVTVGTSTVESVTAAANIFLGVSMTPFLIKPYLKNLTLSELHSVVTSGFATIAGTLMAAYISFGVSASHLMSASVMSAPAALACAKLLLPETEKSKTDEEFEENLEEERDEANVLDAATRGAASAGLLVINITAIVVAFVAFVAFLNHVVNFAGSLVGMDDDFNFEYVLGKIFVPLAYIMGVKWEECESVGKLIGIKTVVNEFVAYRRLGLVQSELSERSVAIATYALCGFANPGCIGIQLAAIGGLCPEKRADVSRVVLRAFVAGSMACFMTGCIAGTLIETR